MKKQYLVRTLILAGSLLLQLGTLCFQSRGAARTPRPANPKLNGRRAALCLAALIAGLGLIPAGRVTAQTFTTLRSFTGSDGTEPQAGLIVSGNTLYGTAALEGSHGSGTVFKFNTDGTGFTILHNFTTLVDPNNEFSPYYVNSDGATPVSELVLSGNTLYGTALAGGSSGIGTIFKVSTAGTDFTIVHTFTGTFEPFPFSNSDGAFPYAGLILSGDTLYGTASAGGILGKGTVFSVKTNGTGFTILHSFTPSSGPLSTNSDGANPHGRLILSGNTLYGTASGGGTSGKGTIFAINANGLGFTNLHSFTALSDTFYTNSDGANPFDGLILSGNTLYGTASGGGSSGGGTVFSLKSDGTDFTLLHNFAAFVCLTCPDADGNTPRGELILVGNTLYGTTRNGGSSGNGTVFRVNTDGTSFTNLHSFTATSCFTCPNTDGTRPSAGLILSGNTLYGTAQLGGSAAKGTVFSLSLPPPPPQLTITRSGANVILRWPTNAAGFTLQSTTNLSLPNSWSPVAEAAVTNAGQISVSVPTTAGRKFFRLKSQ